MPRVDVRTMGAEECLRWHVYLNGAFVEGAISADSTEGTIEIIHLKDAHLVPMRLVEGEHPPDGFGVWDPDGDGNGVLTEFIRGRVSVVRARDGYSDDEGAGFARLPVR